SSVFCFNHTSTTHIYTLSLHDALPIFTICNQRHRFAAGGGVENPTGHRPIRSDRNRAILRRCKLHRLIHMKRRPGLGAQKLSARSEEHTSELQSRGHLVCRLLLEKKNS